MANDLSTVHNKTEYKDSKRGGRVVDTCIARRVFVIVKIHYIYQKGEPRHCLCKNVLELDSVTF
jgi:hypothetical protein